MTPYGNNSMSVHQSGSQFFVVVFSCLVWSSLSNNLARSLGHHRWLRNNPFHLILFSTALVELAKSIPVHSKYGLLTYSSVYLYFFFHSLCPVELSLLDQKTLRHGQTTLVFVSWPWSVHHILQWLLGPFCEPPHWLYGPCTKCSVTFGSISSQRPAFFSLALPSRSMIHKHTKHMEMTMERIGYTVDPRDTVKRQWLEHLWDHGNSFEIWL